MATAAKLRKRPAPRRRTQPVDVRVVANRDDEVIDEEVEQFLDVPLFEVVGDRRVDSIHVERTDPDEGTLGKCPPHWSELDIKRKWGGGTYKLQARDEKNKPMKGGFRTITIAGDPLFESPTAAAKWKRQQGVEPTMAATASTPSLAELLQLLQAKEGSAKTEAEKRISEMERRHALEMEKLQAEAKIRALEKKDEDDRRERERADRDARDKRDREERDERMRKEAEDREDRRRREEQAARERDREFSLTMAQLQKRSTGEADPTAMLVKGIEIAQKVAGGDLDPLSELARNIPGILQTGKELIRPGTTKDDDKTLTLEGPLGLKALALVEHFKRNGIDPATGLSNLFDHVMTLGKQVTPAAGAPAAAAPAAAAPTAPAPAAAPAAAAPAAGSETKVVPITSRRRRRA